MAELMRLAEVIAFLDVTRQTVYNYVARGLLHPVRPFGKGPGKQVLFHRDEVERFKLPTRGRRPTADACAGGGLAVTDHRPGVRSRRSSRR